jgi:hypothetical protein
VSRAQARAELLILILIALAGLLLVVSWLVALAYVGGVVTGFLLAAVIHAYMLELERTSEKV